MNWEKFLPSPKARKIIFYIFIIFILIILIKGNLYPKQEKIILKEKKGAKVGLNKDTDGDGLKDWEEKLYGTNINIRDSDLDGFSDYEEVKKGRDPLIFGVGHEEEIKKIKETKDYIATIEDQKREYQEYKEELWEKYKKESESLHQKIKDTYQYDNANQTNNDYDDFLINKKIDLNNMAKAVLTYEGNPQVKNILRLEKLFVYLSNNPDNIKLEKKDYDYYTYIAKLNLKTAMKLKSLKIKTEELNKLNDILSSGYEEVGKNLEKIINLAKNNKKEKYVQLLKEYGEGQKKILTTNKKLNLFIKTYNIKFSATDEGQLFDYGN